MAREDNFFALLGDQETDDVSEIVDSLKVEEPSKPDDNAAALDEKKEQKPKQKFQMDPRKMRAKRIILPRHVRRSFLVLTKEKKEEAKPQANGEAKEPAKNEVQNKAEIATSTNDNIGQQTSGVNAEKAKTEGKNQPDNNGYHQDQRGYRSGNGYQGNYRRTSYGVSIADGQRNNNDDGYHGGRGRRFQPRKKFSENNGSEKEGEAVTYVNNNQHQQLSQGQEGSGNRGGQGRGFYRRDGSKQYNNGRVYNKVNGDKKSDANVSTNGDNKNGDGVAVEAKEGQAVAASANGDNKGDEDSKARKSNSKGGASKSNWGRDKSVDEAERRKYEEERRKWKTLKEYEASLLEKKKPLEALKKDGGRKVLAEEEFGSMQIIGKNKEEKKSEGKKKHPGHSHEEAKVRKSMSIDAFLKPARTYGRFNYEQRNYGGEEEQSPDNGCHDDCSCNSNVPEFDGHIEDLSQFPALGSNGSA